jgi:uncharacterized protein YcfL
MKKIISLLFATLLSSFLIIGCGSSSGDSDEKAKTVSMPGSSTEQSTALASKDTKPVISGCDSGLEVPGCN